MSRGLPETLPSIEYFNSKGKQHSSRNSRSEPHLLMATFGRHFRLYYCRKTSSKISWFTILSWEQREKFIEDQTDKNRLKRQQMLLIHWRIQNLTFGGYFVCWYHSFSVNKQHRSCTYYEAFFISCFLWEVQITPFWVPCFMFCHQKN